MADGRVHRADDALDFHDELAELARRRAVADRDAVARQVERKRSHALFDELRRERAELRRAPAPAVECEDERPLLAPAARLQAGAKLDLPAGGTGRKLPGLRRVAAAGPRDEVREEARRLLRREAAEGAEQQRNVERDRCRQG